MATLRTSPLQLQEYCSNDPFGNFVTLPETVKDLSGQEVSLKPFYDRAIEVISEPVMILEMKNDEIEFYYFKKSESSSLLIGVAKFEDHFIASRFQSDPTAAQLSILYRKAKQIY
jgi:hypothetical protein